MGIYMKLNGAGQFYCEIGNEWVNKEMGGRSGLKVNRIREIGDENGRKKQWEQKWERNGN
jgi:hypothetical protein